MRNGRWWTVAMALPALAFGKTLKVDDDRRQCPNAQFTRIQDAVNAASPGDTIHVCPGLYEESVTVDKRLTLEGSGPSDPADRTGNKNKESVVRPTNSLNAFNLKADRITLELFTLWDDPSFPYASGVNTVAPYSGFRIECNAIWGFNSGIAMNGNTAYPTLVQWNDLKQPFAAGSAISAGDTAKLTIHANRTRGFDLGVLVNDGGPVHITDNEIVNAYETGIATVHVDDAEIVDNQLRHVGSGILVLNANRPKVLENVVKDVTQGSGIDLENVTHFTVRQNVVAKVVPNQPLSGGFIVGPGSGGTVDNNLVHDSQSNGFFITADNTRFEANKAHDNSQDGFLVFPTALPSGDASNNRMIENTAFKNGEFDADDRNRTQNTWCETWCRTDFPPGTICFKSDPTCH